MKICLMIIWSKKTRMVGFRPSMITWRSYWRNVKRKNLTHLQRLHSMPRYTKNQLLDQFLRLLAHFSKYCLFLCFLRQFYINSLVKCAHFLEALVGRISTTIRFRRPKKIKKTMFPTLEGKTGWWKRKKTRKKSHFCLIFGPGAVCLASLGRIWRANQDNFEKWRYIWKLDRIKFPTSYPGLNLDIGKVVKSGFEHGTVHFLQALCIWH